MDKNNSKYTQYLPRVYQKRSDETDSDYFLGRFLKAFEDVLTGDTDKKTDTLGIEELLDRFHHYLDPLQTPPQFLNWLAGWVGLELEDSVDFYGEKDNVERNNILKQAIPYDNQIQSINRRMIEMEVQLYKILGTHEGLLKHLQIYVGEESTIVIDEFEKPTKIGEVGRVGVGTVVGQGKPYFFAVHAIIPAHNRSILDKKIGILKKVIEREKPIYTNYVLTTEIPSMCIGICSRVGKTTLLGGMAE